MRAVPWIALVALAVWTVLVEPYRLEVTHHEVAATVARRLRVVHVSDLHAHGYGRRERAVVAASVAAAPDVIVLTGDTVDDAHESSAADTLRALRAIAPVYAVRGNWENWRRPEDEAAVLRESGVRLLVNDAAVVRDDAVVVGYDDALSGAPRLVDRRAQIALFHSPTFFDTMAGTADVALSGHSHGGQVRIPFVGAPWVPDGTGRYVSGWFELRGTRMYVSRGVGTSVLPIRFACRPELAVIDLVPHG